MDKAWKDNLRKRGFTADTVHWDTKNEDLKTKLLERGGEAVILVYDIDKYRDRLVSEGKFFGQNFVLDKPHVGFCLDEDEVWRLTALDEAYETGDGLQDFYGIPIE